MLLKMTSAGTFLWLVLALFLPAVSAQSLASSPREERLLNGMKLLMFPDKTSDKVWVRLRIHSGSAFDPQGKEGVMKLLAADIFPNPEMKEFFTEELGGSLDIEENYDYTQVTASSKPDEMLRMLETVSSAITNLAIDKETTAKLKAAQLKRVEEINRDPNYVADQAAAARLLGTFPYGRPEDGTPASIGKIDYADLILAKQRFLTSDNATMVVSGKFDQDLVYRAIRRYMGSWLKSDKLVPSTFRQPDEPPTAVLTVDSPDANRFGVRFITRGTSRGGADTAVYSIAAKVLESRMKSLVPSGSEVAVRSNAYVLPGTFVIAFTSSKGAENPKVEANDLIPKLLGSSVTDAEFQSAKQAYLTDLEKEAVADRWLDVDTYKIDTPAKEQAKAAATSAADVQRVLTKIQKQPFATVLLSSEKTTAAN